MMDRADGSRLRGIVAHRGAAVGEVAHLARHAVRDPVEIAVAVGGGDGRATPASSKPQGRASSRMAPTSNFQPDRSA